MRFGGWRGVCSQNCGESPRFLQTFSLPLSDSRQSDSAKLQLMCESMCVGAQSNTCLLYKDLSNTCLSQ